VVKNNVKFKPIVLIFIVAIIGFFVSGIPFRIFAKLSVGDEYKNIYAEYENMNQDINLKSLYEENQDYLIKKVNELNIDREILQEEIISELIGISRKNNIELSSIKFSEAMPILSDDTGISMKVTVDFDSEFNKVLKFVDDVKNSCMLVSVEDISVLTIESGVHAAVNILFYALPMNILVQGHETVV